MYLVTGAAGFIGFHLCKELLLNQISVVGIDNMMGGYADNISKDIDTVSTYIHKEKKYIVDQFLYMHLV